MSRESALQPWTFHHAERSSNRLAPPVLIQVPALRAIGAHSGHSRLRAPQGPRRRRLRREVRVTCYALLSTVPLAFVVAFLSWGLPGSLFGSVPTVQIEAVGAETARVPMAPVITISLDPTVLVPAREGEPPVVFPGYLLPDDGSEEPANAGS